MDNAIGAAPVSPITNPVAVAPAQSASDSSEASSSTDASAPWTLTKGVHAPDPSARLTEVHQHVLAERGVSLAVAAAARLKSMTPDSLKPFLGYRPSSGGLAIPYLHLPEGEYVRCRQDDGEPRYVVPKGKAIPVYVPTAAAREGSSQLFVTEAPLKALALLTHGYQAVGLGGTGTTLEKTVSGRELNDSWKDVELTGRLVTIVFDAGRANNPNVARDEARLAMALEARGADVWCVSIPLQKNGDDRGPDDFIVQEGIDAFKKLILKRTPADPVKLVESFSSATGGAGCVLDLHDNLPFWIAITQRGAGCKDRVRTALKALGFSNKAFDEAIEHAEEKLKEAAKKEASSDQEHPTVDFTLPYEVRDGVLTKIERRFNDQTEQMEEYVEPLATFAAEITAEEVRDDGQEQTRVFVVTGGLPHKAKFPAVRLRAEDFEDDSWAMNAWGTVAITKPKVSARELRTAIQAVSKPTPVRVHTASGWTTTAGSPVFVHAGGAIGEDGVSVDLNSALKNYRLPNDKGDVQLAVRTSLDFLSVAPDTVTFPLLGCMYRAPTVSALLVDSMIWLYGKTGRRKSSLAAVALSHFGSFTKNNLPGNWESTYASLESLLFYGRDLPIIIDDFVPKTSELSDEYQKKAQKIVRAHGNGSSRGRMRHDLTARPDRPSRGLVISTAEELPEGASIISRLGLIR